ncbi:MAG: (2Fe-2S)-binding protein [Nitrososphaerales archaeon]
MIVRTESSLVSFKVNGENTSLLVAPRDTLLDVLRDSLGKIGAKKGCDEAVCGACSVLYNGKSICSCTILAMEAQGSEIITIEGLGNPEGRKNSSFHDPLQEAFVQFDAQQCGFCTSGQILSARSFLNQLDRQRKEEGGVADETIREALSGNICRCGCYNKIIDAVRHVIELEHL